MPPEVKREIEKFSFYRELTHSFLEVLSDDKLKLSAGNNMCSLGRQFKHMADIEKNYVDAIITKQIIFTDYQENFEIENSQIKLKEILLKFDNCLSVAIENYSGGLINWKDEQINLIEHIDRLIDHEILHCGELVVYFRMLKINLPQKWIDIWSL